MRTAKEICKDSINHLGYGTDEAFIQSVIDEAIAHGMTISAEIAEKLYQDSNFHPMLQDGADNVRLSVIKARDNKVWRKE